ncbi:transposase family protein [Nonomuraea sp. B5E05]|uniref:transposase family protein n=1 Tax=Nonomuraea sp. B5E05 TaxID=3153569 RepID=UPI0032617AEF
MHRRHHRRDRPRPDQVPGHRPHRAPLGHRPRGLFPLSHPTQPGTGPSITSRTDGTRTHTAATAPTHEPSNAPARAATASDAPPTRASGTQGHRPSRSCPHHRPPSENHDQLLSKRHWAGEHVRVPYKGRKKPASQKTANATHAKLRGPGERANAQLKTWRILHKLRCCPLLAGQLVKAILVLQLREAG